MIKALIADDSLKSRMLLKEILSRSFSIETVEAANGRDALRKISSEHPDIVFLDYEMPVMDGRETLRAIRSDPATRHLPVVIVTSHSERELVRELLSYRVSAYLTKPLSTDYVVKRLAVILPKPGVDHQR